MKEEIQTPIQTYQRSLNEAKLHLVSAVYSDDAMFIGQPFPKATGIEKIVATYPNAFSKLNFDVQFDIQEIEPNGDLRFIRTQSHGTIVPKGENSKRSEGNREIFVVKKIKVSGSSTGKSSMPSSGGPSAF